MIGVVDRDLNPPEPVRALAAMARALRRAAGNPRAANGMVLPALIAVSDAERMADPVAATALLPPRTAVLLRHYRHTGRTRLAHALAAACRARNLTLIVAGDAGLARAVGAAGVHYPEGTPFIVAPGLFTTVAAHSLAAVRAAVAGGADAVLLSPVFATASHPGVRAMGVARFARLVAASAVPVFALGGITAANALRLTGSGAAGIAAVGALAPRPGAGRR